MGQVFRFPGEQEREWRAWEETIRSTNTGILFDEAVIDAALPAIKAHWFVLFAEVFLQVPPTEIPGPISDPQLRAIQRATDACAETCIARLKTERITAMTRIIGLELKLAYFAKYGFPG